MQTSIVIKPSRKKAVFYGNIIGMEKEPTHALVDTNLPLSGKKQVRKLLETQGPPRPADARNIPLLALDPTTIEADPATYQFRIYIDQHGLDKNHAIGATRWDPVLHGDPLIVHQRKDGKNFVADGHHRLSFAKALRAKGEGPEQVMAYVLKESEGYTAEDAKIIAAYKNIARGDANVVEAALVLKEAREANVAKEKLPAIDKTKGNLPAAETLSHLAKESLDLVAGGDVPAEMAVDAAKEHQPDAVMHHLAQELKKSFAVRLLESRKNTSPNLAL